MRVAMVVTGGLHPSGREQVVPSWLALFDRLSRAHDVHAFALRHLPEAATYSLLGFTVHDLGRPSAPAGFTRQAQERALRRAITAAGPFDLVHGFWGDPAGLLAVRMGRRFGIPSIVTCDSGEFVDIPEIEYGSQRTARGRATVREACAGATRVHVCTRYMATLASQHGVDATIIPLGSSLHIEASGRRRDRPPQRLLQIASLSRVKNQAMSIDALSIASRAIDVHLDLVGEDTLNGALQVRARERGVADRIVFHGFLPQDQLGPIFAGADLYVQSSLHEAAGVSVLEAAAAGVPVVGTRVGYVADWAPERAIAIDVPSAQALAESILMLLSDDSRRIRLATAAREWARTHDAAWTAQQFDLLYRDLS